MCQCPIQSTGYARGMPNVSGQESKGIRSAECARFAYETCTVCVGGRVWRPRALRVQSSAAERCWMLDAGYWLRIQEFGGQASRLRPRFTLGFRLRHSYDVTSRRASQASRLRSPFGDLRRGKQVSRLRLRFALGFGGLRERQVSNVKPTVFSAARYQPGRLKPDPFLRWCSYMAAFDAVRNLTNRECCYSGISVR